MKKVIAAIVVVALIVVGYVFLTRESEADSEVRFITVPVERGTLRAEITSSGTLKPLVEVLVGSQVSGTIREIYADFESKVTKGQLIALIDPDMFKAKADQARADLEAAHAALAKAEVTAIDEARTLKRKETLIERNSISQSDFDAAKTKADAAVAQVAADKARVSQLQAKLEEAELQLKYTRIIAPVDGIVTSRSMDVGQTVTAGFQTPVLFKIAEDLTRMQVHTNVDEADIGRVEVDQKADFTVPAFPDRIFSGVVTQIRNDPKVEQNVVTYNVVMDVENNDLKLRPGMTANVRILLNEVKDALTVTDQALRFIPPKSITGKEKQDGINAAPGEKRVWKLQNGSKIEPISVKTGLVGADRIQIFSDQLKPGDKVVVEAVTKKKQDVKSPAIRFKF